MKHKNIKVSNNVNVFGIDLGTSTCLAYKYDITSNSYINCLGTDTIIPSIVQLTNKEPNIGKNINYEAQGVISSFKRLIGQQFNDPDIQKEITQKTLPYELVSGKHGEVVIKTNISYSVGKGKDRQKKRKNKTHSSIWSIMWIIKIFER